MRTIAKIVIVIVLIFVALVAIGATENYLNPISSTTLQTSVTRSISGSSTIIGLGPGTITTVSSPEASSSITSQSASTSSDEICTAAATVTQNNTTGILTLCHIVSTYTIVNTNSSSTTTYPALSTTSFLNNYNVSISYAMNPIVRGNNETIYVKVIQGNTPVINLPVHVHVTYASQQTTKDFDTATNSTGIAQLNWLIGGNSTPGLFSVIVTIQGYTSSFDSSFQVNADTTT